MNICVLGGTGFVGHLRARQHAGDLFQPRLVFQGHDAGLVAHPRDPEMPGGTRRHLRRMGHQQDLGGFRQALQAFAGRERRFGALGGDKR